MYGPATGLFPREAIRNHKLGDLTIKRGTSIQIGMLTMNYNGKYYDDPFEFKPERWENILNS